MKKALLFLFAVGLFQSIIVAQNRDEFFKSFPLATSEMPEWARLMYSGDPNVWEVDRKYRQFFEQFRFEKSTHTQNYTHWRRLVDPYVNAEGFIRLPSREEEDRRSEILKKRYKQRTESASTKIPGTSTQWVQMGPIETFRQSTLTPVSWHKNVYSFDQSLSHPDVLICGTEAGGVYKSSDRGLHWNLITAGEVFAGGNEAVEIHPADTNVFLVASNRRIYRSTNSGQSWAEEHFMDGSGYEFRFHPVNHDTVFCVGSKGLFRSNDGGDTWSQVYTDKCWDIDFHPTNPDTVYLLKHNPTLKRAEFFRSENAGTSWTIKTNGWFTPSDPTNARDLGAKIGITPASPDMIYVCLIGEGKSGDGGWIGMYRSLDKGDSWVNPAGQDGAPYGAINGTLPWNVSAYSSGTQQGWFNFDMEVSDTDAGRLWVGTIRLSESADSGRTFLSIGAANSQRHSNIHADIQDIDVQNGEVWVACDGGVDFSSDSLQTHIARNHGIRASHFWGFGTGWNIDSYCGGRYHDGTIGWHEGFGIGNVHNIGGVEEASGYVNPMDGQQMLFRTHYASEQTSVKVLPDTLGGELISLASLTKRPNEAYVQSRSSGVYFHPFYANHILIGLDSILYKSTNGGISFEALHTFPGNGKVLEIEWARNDPDVIYVVNMSTAGTIDLCEIYVTTDGGANWSPTTTLSANRQQIEIAVNPENEDEIWVALPKGGSGNYIFESTNGGFNWFNETPAILNGEDITDIMFEMGGGVYVTTWDGIFYRDPNTGTWSDYGLGLPLIARSLKIKPFYRDAELRLASKGRGVFARKMADTAFAVQALPVTFDDTVYCTRDTVNFDCRSIMKHAGASWSWAFSPNPAWVSSTTSRNPKVVFGTEGSYTVTLAVTDGNSQTDSRTVINMVTVKSLCEADSLPGMALKTTSNGDWVQTPDFAMAGVDSFTITAWVKPNGIQPDYTSIVMNDETSAGFNFGQGNNTLQYHWTGGAWWWSSGLIVPANEWSHVAMVATPSGMTVYVNGISSTHNTSLSPVDLGTMKIGSYKAWSSRNYNGEIDEVCMWDRALSADEIRDMRHLTKEKALLQDPDLIAYYQFNEPEANGRVMDKVGTRHASLAGNANLQASTAPVGGGKSQRLAVNSSGSYLFNDVGVKMDFASGTYPNGELVVSRIHVNPDSFTNNFNKLDYYWIINNYGSNQSFTALDSLIFSPHDAAPSLAAISNPFKVRLHIRSDDNEHLNNWNDQCAAVAVRPGSNGVFAFSNTCAINSFSQFQIAASDAITNLLPLELLAFEAEAAGTSSVKLNWRLMENHRLAFVEVEHSTNGVAFEKLAKVFDNQSLSHSFLHQRVEAGKHVYRLKLVDTEGEIQYSVMRSVWLSGEHEGIVIYPNPVEKGGALRILNRGEGPARLYLYSSDGKLVLNEILKEQQNEVSVAALGAGLYYYSFQSGSRISNGVLVVE